MQAEDLLAWLRATPFEPFRIRLNGGRTFEIRHVEMLRVGKSTANVFSFVGEPADPYEKMEMVSLAAIESVESIETGHIL